MLNHKILSRSFTLVPFTEKDEGKVFYESSVEAPGRTSRRREDIKSIMRTLRMMSFLCVGAIWFSRKGEKFSDEEPRGRIKFQSSLRCTRREKTIISWKMINQARTQANTHNSIAHHSSPSVAGRSERDERARLGCQVIILIREIKWKSYTSGSRTIREKKADGIAQAAKMMMKRVYSVATERFNLSDEITKFSFAQGGT